MSPWCFYVILAISFKSTRTSYVFVSFASSASSLAVDNRSENQSEINFRQIKIRQRRREKTMQKKNSVSQRSRAAYNGRWRFFETFREFQLVSDGGKNGSWSMRMFLKLLSFTLRGFRLSANVAGPLATDVVN